MSNKKSNSNKIEPCPCPKEKFQDSKSESTLLEKFNSVDNTIIAFFGNSKLIIGNKSYKLKNYRWFIIIGLLFILFLIVSSIRNDPKQIVPSVPLVVNPVAAPVVVAK